MNTPVTKITIPTDQLRSLLPAEALIEIQASAIEKVAEEVRRKITAKGDDIMGIVTRHVADVLKDELRQQTATVSSTWRFPEAGKAAIRDLTKQAIDDRLRTLVVEAVDAVEAKMAARFERHIIDTQNKAVKVVNDALEKVVARMNTTIETKARAEFLAVLKEAKEAGL